MRRLEQQTAAREQRMRAEAEDLQQRCQEAEARAQDLSAAVPQVRRFARIGRRAASVLSLRFVVPAERHKKRVKKSRLERQAS